MDDASIDEEPPALPFLVAGIGASAGGLEALQELFEHIPAETGVAFVVVQHLSPDFDSMMVELLARRAAIRVVEAEDGTQPVPNHLYVLPPKKDITLEGGMLRLRDRPAGLAPHLPIDRFFASLARDQGEHGVAVVLSGTGSDGSRGVVSVRTSGGLVMAQSPESAKFNGMPNAAIATAMVDFVGGPAEIARRLQRRLVPTERAVAVEAEPALGEVLDVFHARTGVDLRKYKRGTVLRRLHRRMAITENKSLGEYLEHLRNDESEAAQLRLEMLIGVSSFFRDAPVWAFLKDELLPTALENSTNTAVRCWVAACSTGEEAYTLAVVLHEVCHALGRPADFRIFATDVSQEAIRHASDGVYSLDALQGVPEALRNRYFERTETSYRAHRVLRERITFATHNLLSDPPFTRLDFVSCRNVLIYLRPDAQRLVLSRIHFGMLPGASLLLGSSETIGDLTAQFATRSVRHKVYEAHGGSTWIHQSMPVSVSRPPPPTRAGPMEHLYRTVLRRYVPTGVATDERFDIVHVFGDVRPYLALPEGRVSTNLLRMVPPSVGVLLNSAARRARESGTEVRLTAVPIHDDVRELHVRAYQTAKDADSVGYLVFFHESRPDVPSASMDVGDASVARIHQLEEELSLTRDHLRTAVQDLEGSNEELQATNEELVAANEELQSTNEELQSVNEELHTVNTEHQQRILELSELSDDLSNLLRLVQIGTIFLDGRLAVRRYNGGATRVVPLQPHDVGRRITDLRWEVPYPQLADDTAAVLGGQGPIDRELVSPNGELWHVSVQPYRSDDSVAGLVITTLLAAASQETSLTLQYRRASELSGIAAVFVHPSTAEVGALERAEVVLGLARDSLTAQAVLDAALETADGASGALRAGEVELRVRTHREGTGTDTILVMLDRT